MLKNEKLLKAYGLCKKFQEFPKDRKNQEGIIEAFQNNKSN